MPSRLQDYLIALSAALYLSASAFAMAATSPDLVLLSRSASESVPVTFELSQRQWLLERNELILGTSAPDYPPFDMTVSGKDYEGLTADYAGLLSQASGLPIRVKRFPSRDAAIRALVDGQVDLLGTANGFEAGNANLALSVPYAKDQPVLVTREDETRSLTAGLAGLRLSMVYHYLPVHEVKALYPKALITC